MYLALDPINILLAMTGVLLVALGAAVFSADIRERANLTFGLFCLFLALWTLTIIGFRAATAYDAAILWMKLAYAAAFPIGVSFWFFAQSIVDGRSEHGAYRRRSLILHSALGVLYLSAILGTDLIVRRWQWLPDGTKRVDVWPFGWWMYALYFLSYFLVGNLLLLKKFWQADGQERRRMRTLVLGCFLGGEVFGVFFNLLLPSPLFDQWHHIWAGPLLTAAIMMPFVTYGIFKYRLLNVKIIATETLVLAVSMLTFLNLFTTATTQEFIIHAVIFSGVTLFGFLLISSVRGEVRRREEVQRLATELAASNKRLRQLDDLKTTMVSIASHQIRGPLGGIRGYMTMFRDGDLGALTDKQKEIVTLNLNVLTRLLNAVETFLDITKIESGKLSLRKETLPLDEAVENVVQEFQLPASKKGIALSLAYRCPRPVWVDFDPEKIGHVIFNLVDNALKYTEQGAINVVVRCEKGEAIFEVTDTGMGIPVEDAARLFGKYERGELALDRGGSGLGLYVVKMLTEMQGGRVWAVSPGAGRGSTFGFALPCKT